MTRVFVLDDHELVRHGLRAILEPVDGIEVVGESPDAAHALGVIRSCRPDVALIDLRPGDGSGIDLCRRITEEFPDVGCVIFTSLESDLARIEAYRAGASAFVTKQAGCEAIVDAVRDVAAGRRPLDEATIRRCERRVQNTDQGHFLALTPQEQRILEHIRVGRTNRQIAAEMGLSPVTVKNYVSNMLTSLQVTSRTEAAALAGRVAAHRHDF